MRIRERFNPRAPCGARLPRLASLMQDGHISTHAPLAGRDALGVPPPDVLTISTHAPLAGRDRSGGGCTRAVLPISTHAPLAGRDRQGGQVADDGVGFQPTRPLRGATRHRCRRTPTTVFQPTRPLRGATPQPLGCAVLIITISTHAPLAGRDSDRHPFCKYDSDFNPRAPCGARRMITG